MRVFRDAGLALLLFVLPAVSQSTEAPHQPSAEPAQSSTPQTSNSQMAHHRRHQAPCWRVAKLSPDLVNQRWHIEDQGRVEIEAVCRDPKTNAQQKQEKIRAIHQEKAEEFAKIVPADQLKVFNACQAERDKEKPKESPGEKELGPCGGVIPKNAQSGMGDMHDH